MMVDLLFYVIAIVIGVWVPFVFVWDSRQSRWWLILEIPILAIFTVLYALVASIIGLVLVIFATYQTASVKFEHIALTSAVVSIVTLLWIRLRRNGQPQLN
jgi:hypothetical protein